MNTTKCILNEIFQLATPVLTFNIVRGKTHSIAMLIYLTVVAECIDLAPVPVKKAFITKFEIVQYTAAICKQKILTSDYH